MRKRTNTFSVAAALVLSLVGCDRPTPEGGKTSAPDEPSTDIWEELDLTTAKMNEFCAAETLKDSQDTRDKKERLLDTKLPPTQQIDTDRWKGFLRYVPGRSGLTPSDEMCFVRITTATKDVRTVDSFREQLGLPSCETEFTYPNAILCLVPDGDRSGLAMWQARFTADRELVALGLSTQGFSPARDEKMFAVNFLRPKDRPKLELSSQDFTNVMARLEIDDIGVTYDITAPWFDDLETPAVRGRFGGKKESCLETSSRCTFPEDTDATKVASQLHQMLRRQLRWSGTQDPTPEQTKRKETIAIDAAADAPWSDVELPLVVATSRIPRVLLIADGPDNGPLPTLGYLELTAPEPPPPGGVAVREVEEPDGAKDTRRSVTLKKSQIVVSGGGEAKAFATTGDGHDWDAVHEALLEMYPEQLTRAELDLHIDKDVPWRDVFKLAEVASYRRADYASPDECSQEVLPVEDSVPCQTQRLFRLDFEPQMRPAEVQRALGEELKEKVPQ